MDMMGMLIRFFVSALVLLFLSFILPGFTLAGFFNALLTAIVIALLGFVLESLAGTRRVSPQSRGLVGFLSSAAVIYAAQYFISAFRVSIIGSLLAAFLIGLLDLIVPTELR